MNNVILRNFRNISDSNSIELKPLTFLVGENGAGKSSFLRLFPLLKQSINEPKRGPLLWYTENGVDFGDFKTTVMKGESVIGIGFDVYVYRQAKEKIPVSIFMCIESEKSDEQYDFISSLKIQYKDVKIGVEYHQNKAFVSVNGFDVGSFPCVMLSYSLFPNVFCDGLEEDEKMLKELGEKLAATKSMDFRYSYDYLFVSFGEFEKMLQDIVPEMDLEKLFAKTVCLNLSEIQNSIWMTLSNEMRDLIYIGPFRNSPQRYYRLQNKSTRMIDMKGSNMAVFVNAMSKEQMQDLNRKLKQQFGFELAYESKFGQVSLFIKKDKKKTNLIDNGYGYSQLMPLLLAINAFNQRRVIPFDGTDILCIEQPELHLHPKMQAVFGSTLTNSVINNRKYKNTDKIILIETHSRQIIESVGKAIYEKQIKPEEVAVYLFEQDKDKASIRKTEFDKEGYLMNWPIGFLD